MGSDGGVMAVAQAVTFLDYAHRTDDRLADLFEVIIGTGLRRGEALALRWPAVGLEARVVFVHPDRGTLSDVAGHLMVTAPTTKGSAAGVGLSTRVVAAFTRQAARQALQRAEWAEVLPGRRPGVRPSQRSATAPRLGPGALPRSHRPSRPPPVRLHDLRHLTATIMITSGVPVALVSTTLRHTTSGITADLYGHLTAEATLAANSLGNALDAAAAELANEHVAREALV